MDYIDVYFSRVNHLGPNTAKRIRNGGIISLKKWMAESPHTVQGLTTEKNVVFDGILNRNKDKEYQKILFLHVDLKEPLQVGDIINWEQDDGTIEKWLIFLEEKKVNGTYRTFWITRCNYLLKWVDAQGHLQQSWGYVVSSVDSKIKGNFRTWNSLITPQANKYMEILMPRYPIERSTNFIIEEESWNVVEYDHTSVPGVVYLSLTENKVNTIYDDLVNNIADTDKLSVYDLSIPEEEQVCALGGQIHPIFTLTKNGIPVDLPVVLEPADKQMIEIINDKLFAKRAGRTSIIVRLKDYPTISQILPLRITSTPIFSAYIEGPDTIKLDREATYKLVASENINGDVIFSIENIKLVNIINSTQDTCSLRANDENKLGSTVLKAEYGGKIYSKEIKIIPLW